MVTPEEIVAYWVDEIGPKGWYAGGDALDAQILERFEPTLIEARAGACGLWMTTPVGILGYLILTDQFTRNMYRGQAEAFACDASARSAAKTAIEKDWDMRIPEPERQFFYMPLMHSENLIDQDRCVRLMCKRLPEGGDDNLRHARAHRDIVRQFGRFPYRNAALGRVTTARETDWVENGGYAATLKALDAVAAAG